ncbi:MAG: polysaccharide deacetylase family protein [PVC group bacterium]
MNVGLRIDADTYNGTRSGVPVLLDILARNGIRASFFFSVGADNMGRHIRRLLKPRFFLKMLRSNTAGLYGWDILLRGTFRPGPDIAAIIAPPLRRADRDGHEIGLHALDHHRWQQNVQKFSVEEIAGEIREGCRVIRDIIGREPDCFAAPGWKGTDNLLRAEEDLRLRYASDCRGRNVFRPAVNGRTGAVPQVPVTLPTYDEVIGGGGLSDHTYNEYLFSLMADGRPTVLAIHAEVEGMRKRWLFEEFLERARERPITFAPLGSLLPSDPAGLPAGIMGRGTVPGREGWVAVQETE